MILKNCSFSTPQGVTENFFSAVSADKYINFESEAAALLAKYDAALANCSCSQESEVLLRIHLSDITNQQPVLEKLLANRRSFISIVGQAPADHCIALEAWHWSNVNKVFNNSALQLQMQNYSPLWFRLEKTACTGSFDQTYEEFSALKDFLAQHNSNVKDHTVRTWLYCRDVDNNYAGLVQARNKFFAENGLTADTHFIASTGIEGVNSDVKRLVKMDSINYPALQAGQQQYLAATDMLSPTALYGVSFERATRLIFGDRSHYFISGTASIDHLGKVLHIGNVLKQTERMLDNIEALLREGNADLRDIKLCTLYLRDLTDAAAVEEIIFNRLDRSIPLVTLKAPVCRPTWLVEMECIAVNSKGCSQYPNFC